MQTEHPVPSSGLPPHEDEINLADSLRTLRRHWRMVLIVLVTVFAGVAWYTYQQQPVYEAFSTIQVQGKRSGMMVGIDIQEQNTLATDIEILKSRSLAEKVALRLNLQWQVSSRSPGLNVDILDFRTTVENTVYKVQLGDDGHYLLSNDKGQLAGEGKVGTVLQAEGVELLLKRLEGEVGDSFTITHRPLDAIASTLQGRVGVRELGQRTNVLRLSIQDTDPNRARDVVNTMAQVYYEQSIAQKNQEAAKTVAFIDEQLTGLQSALADAESSLLNYQLDSGLKMLGPEATFLIERVIAAEGGRTQTGITKSRTEAAIQSIQAAMTEGSSYTPSYLIEDSRVTSLAQKLSEFEVRKRVLLDKYTESHPSVADLRKQITELQRELLAVYNAVMRKTMEADAEFTSELAGLDVELKRLPEAEQHLARLTRLAKVNENIYTFLLQKREESRIAQAAATSSVQIIDPALAPSQPIKPDKRKNLTLALAIGLILGVGCAFLLDYLDDSIKDPDTAKRLLGLSNLALIPYIGLKNEKKKVREAGAVPPERILVSHLDPRSLAAEAFRGLRTALHFSGNGRDNKVLLITSAFPGEGKTTVSANLAVTLAQTGSRVLLVGCDLRKPTLHEMFDHPNVPGLTDCLVGDAQLDEAVHATGMFKLDFLGAGTVPPNPAELLGSTRMQEMIDSWRRQYDIIILDAPPVLAVTDAAVLTRFTDSTIVVLQVGGGVGAKAALRMMEILTPTQTRMAGMVLNDKTNKGSGYYGYYSRYGKHGYGYGYGYGYGVEEEKKDPVRRSRDHLRGVLSKLGKKMRRWI